MTLVERLLLAVVVINSLQFLLNAFFLWEVLSQRRLARMGEVIRAHLAPHGPHGPLG